MAFKFLRECMWKRTERSDINTESKLLFVWLNYGIVDTPYFAVCYNETLLKPVPVDSRLTDVVKESIWDGE